jgi:hypothetical protein
VKHPRSTYLLIAIVLGSWGLPVCPKQRTFSTPQSVNSRPGSLSVRPAWERESRPLDDTQLPPAGEVGPDGQRVRRPRSAGGVTDCDNNPSGVRRPESRTQSFRCGSLPGACRSAAPRPGPAAEAPRNQDHGSEMRPEHLALSGWPDEAIPPTCLWPHKWLCKVLSVSATRGPITPAARE